MTHELSMTHMEQDGDTNATALSTYVSSYLKLTRPYSSATAVLYLLATTTQTCAEHWRGVRSRCTSGHTAYHLQLYHNQLYDRTATAESCTLDRRTLLYDLRA